MDIQPFLKSVKHKKIGGLKNSKYISKSGIYLPTYIGINENEIIKVCNKITNFMDNI